MNGEWVKLRTGAYLVTGKVDCVVYIRNAIKQTSLDQELLLTNLCPFF